MDPLIFYKTLLSSPVTLFQFTYTLKWLKKFPLKIQNQFFFPIVTKTHMYPLERGINRVKPLSCGL